ncbi:MAG: adenylate/guanylate cyclase domain-containing protein, partial [Actinomycetota bacterium]
GTRLRGRLADEGLAVRIGVHAGEVDRRGDDVSGLAVNIAARVMALAEAGQILGTEVVRLIADRVDFVPIGHHELAGIDGTWPLHELDP